MSWLPCTKRTRKGPVRRPGYDPGLLAHPRPRGDGMAKAGMRRPDPKEPYGTESNHKTTCLRTSSHSVPEIKGKHNSGLGRALSQDPSWGKAPVQRPRLCRGIAWHFPMPSSPSLYFAISPQHFSQTLCLSPFPGQCQPLAPMAYFSGYLAIIAKFCTKWAQKMPRKKIVLVNNLSAKGQKRLKFVIFRGFDPHILRRSHLYVVLTFGG